MTIEMDQPFVWPDPPSDEVLEQGWSKKTYALAEKEQEDYGESRGRLADARVDTKARERMREMAERLLSGKERWRPGAGTADGNRAIA